jgi:hypothetical protein
VVLVPASKLIADRAMFSVSSKRTDRLARSASLRSPPGLGFLRAVAGGGNGFCAGMLRDSASANVWPLTPPAALCGLVPAEASRVDLKVSVWRCLSDDKLGLPHEHHLTKTKTNPPRICVLKCPHTPFSLRTEDQRGLPVHHVGTQAHFDGNLTAG